MQCLTETRAVIYKIPAYLCSNDGGCREVDAVTNTTCLPNGSAPLRHIIILDTPYRLERRAGAACSVERARAAADPTPSVDRPCGTRRHRLVLFHLIYRSYYNSIVLDTLTLKQIDTRKRLH